MSVYVKNILRELSDVKLEGNTALTDVLVETVCTDSRKAAVGSLFVCIQGFVSDGHDYALSAYAQGCRLFLTQRRLSLPADALQVLVPDTRIAQAEACAVFYGHPERELRLVGVTGTKGKTTTALFLQAILNGADIPTGYIGTNGVSFGEVYHPTVNSTPDSLLLYAYLREMADAGMRAAVMEVSSQGLKLNRIGGLTFHACVFTNLSPDHIGGNEHPDMQDYTACKKKLFTDYPHAYTVCNLDDPATPYMISHDPAQIIGVSTCGHRDADWQVSVMQGIVKNGIPGMEYACRRRSVLDEALYFLPQPGEFNIKNAMCAVAVACDAFGVSLETACHTLENVSVPGRFETVFHDHVLYVIDYAHNGVSMTSMLELLKGYHPDRLICLFGSVGERTKERRRELAEAVGPRADLCILTSDNPGREDPEDILAEIDEAFPEGSCPRVRISDRAQAVAYAVSVAKPGDTVLLAGKGHEKYQLIGTEKIHYSDRETLLSLLG